MSAPGVCAECGTAIPQPYPEGFCPRCLLSLALTRSENTSAEVPEAKTIGNYELLECIGQGGMGIVYRARQIPLNRIVAVKLLRAGSLATETETRRFRKEAEAAAALKHPHVVAIHEVGEHQGRPFFSMDYIAGQSLAQVIKRTPLPAERAARYARVIAEAIHYAHRQGVLHRDLKPANVLIDAADQPHITDFGLAKQIEVEADLTLTGAILGTPSYMPPEQAAGRRKAVGPTSDVYSLGAILYDLLTGRPPFRAETPVDTLRQVLDTEPAPPRLVNPKVPHDLETICLKCLAKEPGQRYESAQALADDLGRFLRHEPIHARPIRVLARGGRWCRRHPALAISLGTVGLLLVAVATAALLFARDLERQLRQQVLQGNLYAARGVASSVLLQFQDWSKVLTEVAENAELRRMLAQPDEDELKAFVHQLHLDYVNPKDKSLFQSWYVQDLTGKLLAISPEKSSNTVIGQRFEGRDSFKGALRRRGLRGQSSVHISKGFQSLNDDYFKFALSAPVYAGPETDAQVVGIVAATIITSSTLGSLTLKDDRSVAVLVVRKDPNLPTGPPEAQAPDRWLVLVHPEHQKPGRVLIEVRNPRLATVHRPLPPPHDEMQNVTRAELSRDQQVDDNYRDPLLPGKWLAAFSPVGNTECVVIIQTPYHEVSSLNRNLFRYLGLWGGLALGVATALAAVVTLLLRLQTERECERNSAA